MVFRFPDQMKAPTFELFGERLRDEFSFKAAREFSRGRGNIKTLVLVGRDRTARNNVLSAIAAQATLTGPSPRVLNISARALGHVMRDAARRGQLFQLEEALIGLDWLLISDWQSLPRDSRLQETLCVVFDRLFDRGRHLVVATSCELASLRWLTPRLKSRFHRSVLVRLESARKTQKEALPLSVQSARG